MSYKHPTLTAYSKWLRKRVREEWLNIFYTNAMESRGTLTTRAGIGDMKGVDMNPNMPVDKQNQSEPTESYDEIMEEIRLEEEKAELKVDDYLLEIIMTK